MQNIMKLLLFAAFILGGYFFVLQMLLKRMNGQRGKGAVALVLFFLFLILGGILVLIFMSAGNIGTSLFILFLFTSVMLFGGTVVFMIQHFREMKKDILILLLVYISAVFYMTIFSRQDHFNSSVNLELFCTLEKAVREGSLEVMRHLILNCVMFIPIGFLLPLTEPKRLSAIGYILAVGLLLSTGIESVQLFWQIGQCDIDDIIGNTFGTFVGGMAFQLFSKLKYAAASKTHHDIQDY